MGTTLKLLSPVIILLLLNFIGLARGSGCNTNEFMCEDKTECISMSDFCDAEIDCGDKSDEIYSSKSNSSGFYCTKHMGYGCLLPYAYQCDGFMHCDDGSDECSCKQNSAFFCNGDINCKGGLDECFCVDSRRSDTMFSDDKCFRCLDGSKIISTTDFCDGVIHCDDLSDECLCGTGNNIGICDHIIWSQPQVAFSCAANMKGPFFSISKVCDERKDCLSGVDEIYCNPTESTEPNDNDEKAYTCRNPRNNNPHLNIMPKNTSRKCDNHPTCPLLDDECEGCDPIPEYCKFVTPLKNGLSSPNSGFHCLGSNKKLWGSKICDGSVRDCPGGEDELFCSKTDRFFCADSADTTSTIHIPLSKKCDLKKDCDDSSDELNCDIECENCDRCKQKHFYCPVGEPKYIDCNRKVCDGNEDCWDGEDECQNCTRGIFSNDDRLISSTPLLPFLWIISLTAVIGNLMVIASSIVRIMTSRKNKSDIEESQNVMILNLATADFFVGIYTLAISIQNIILSSGDRYCLHDHEWRSSSSCSSLGAILTIGSEGSVFILTIVTALRLKAVIRPFSKGYVKTVYKVSLASWSLALILALIPLAPSTRDYFVESIWYERNSVLSNVKRENLQLYTEKLVAFRNLSSSYVYDNGGIGSWQLLEKLMYDLNPDYIPKRRFGYYSSHGVCLPNFFPAPEEDAAWGYSLVIILINFFSLFFIFAAYIVIYRKATSSKVHKASTVERCVVLQKKITRIVATDFVCWMPICIMSFLQVSGFEISKQVYVPVGTILIPINSMLNPFLYSEAPEWIWKQIKPVGSRFHARWKLRHTKDKGGDFDAEMDQYNRTTPAETEEEVVFSSAGKSS
uniref:uncharacterized protein LOC120326321 isoform X1 n=1 Tax=Styela clava TaxID=7725 RepID=UPI001939692F|nr:uncharacterized protein LOC120326321 isoform X1 [Styela clava]